MKKLNLKKKTKMTQQAPVHRARVGESVLQNIDYELRGRAAPDQTELFVYASSTGELVAYSCTTSDRELRADRREFEDDFFPELAVARELRAPDEDW